MNTFRSCLMIMLMSASFLLGGCDAAKCSGARTTSVEEYYQGTLPLADIGAIASDWDQVIANTDEWKRNMRIITTLLLSEPWATLKLCFNSEMWSDIKKAKKHLLLDPKTGHKIYGSDNYVQFFIDKYGSQLGSVKESLVDIINEVNPIYSTCALYATLGFPLVIWTNNNYVSYEAKLANLNKHATADTKGIPMNPQTVFVAGSNPDFPEEQRNLKGKPDKEYYTRAYAYTKKALNLSDTASVIFVDDMAVNVHGLREVAKELNLPLIGIQYTTPEQLEYDFNLLMGKEAVSPIQDVPEPVR